MQPTPCADISELFLAIADGHEPSFAILYQQYYNRVFTTALKYCKVVSIAEDVAQHVFLIVWEKRTKLVTIENGESWLWAVARNRTLSVLRKEASRQTYITHIKERFEQEQHSPLQELLNKEKEERIEMIINTLPGRQQHVYRLSRSKGMTYAEIAKALKLSPATVKEYMSNALKTMRKMLLQHKDEILLLVTGILIENIFLQPLLFF